MAFPAVVAVLVHGHEHARTADVMGALTSQAGDLVVGVNLVKLEHSKLDLFLLCLIFLGLVYVFFLRFLPPPSSPAFKNRVDSSSTPHSPRISVATSERPPKIRRCSSKSSPSDATLSAASQTTDVVSPARSRTKICILGTLSPLKSLPGK